MRCSRRRGSPSLFQGLLSGAADLVSLGCAGKTGKVCSRTSTSTTSLTSGLSNGGVVTARGDVIIVRYCDDFIVGFQHQDEAERFWVELRERFHRFNLELHPEKTRLIEFGRFAVERRKRRGEGKPETFDFLGFTHICGKTRKGKFTVRRRTVANRLRRKLHEVKQTLRKRMCLPIPSQGTWLRAVLLGYYRYFAVPRNSSLLRVFREGILRSWCRTLRRRSQRHRITWRRMYALAQQWLPQPRILHPYPAQRLCVTT